MKRITGIACAVIAFLSIFTVGCGCGKRQTLTNYNIECALSGDVITGNESVTFYNHTENAFNQLKFNLYGNAFRQNAKYQPVSAQYCNRAYYDGQSYGEMNVISVKEGGEPLNFEVGGKDENVLTVDLKEYVYPGENVAVDVEFTLKLAKVIARTGITRNTINLANFYPVLCGIQDGGFYECVYYSAGDPYYADCADYDFTFTADEKYVVAVGGKLVSSHVGGGKRTSKYILNKARSLCLVLSEKFETITDNSTGREINYYYYDDPQPEKSLKAAADAVKLYEKTFGAYPYQTYTVAQTEFIQGGMEFSSLVMISDALEQPEYLEVIAHETAHQWWQGAVGNNEIEYAFLDEGLAEYSVVLFYENYSEYGFTREECITAAEKTYKTFCSVYEKMFENTDTSMIRNLGEFSSEYEYVNIAYVKPAIMYDCLRKTIGDKRFFGALRRYYSDHLYKNATPDDLVGAFEKSGADTNGFFKGFFDGSAIL